MINIDTHFFLEARRSVDFMTTIKERVRDSLIEPTMHDAFQTVSNLLWLLSILLFSLAPKI